MAVKRGLPPAQLKEDLGPLKIEFGGQYVNQLMITSMLYGEENTTKNYKTNWVWCQLSAFSFNMRIGPPETFPVSQWANPPLEGITINDEFIHQSQSILTI
ncbi:hypothetical protein QTP88_024565 [Uroleucon formosanum]